MRTRECGFLSALVESTAKGLPTVAASKLLGLSTQEGETQSPASDVLDWIWSNNTLCYIKRWLLCRCCSWIRTQAMDNGALSQSFLPIVLPTAILLSRIILFYRKPMSFCKVCHWQFVSFFSATDTASDKAPDLMLGVGTVNGLLCITISAKTLKFSEKVWDRVINVTD